MRFLRSIRHSFSARISLYIIAIVNALFVAAFVVVYLQTSESIKNVSIANAQKDVKAAAASVERELQVVKQNADGIRLLFQSGNFELDSLWSVMRGYVQSSDIIAGAGMFFEDSFCAANNYHQVPYVYQKDNQLFESDLKDKVFEFSEKEWYTAPQRSMNGYWTNPYLAEMGLNEQICSYSSPLTDAKGEFLGVVVVDVSLSWLNNKCNGFNAYPNSLVMVVNQSGNYVVNTGAPHIVNTSFFDFARLQPDSAVVCALGRKMINGNEGYTETDARSVPSYVFYCPIGTVGWSLALVNNKGDIVSALDTIMRNTAICCVVAIALIFVFCIVVIRRISKPIVGFAQRAKQIAHGEFDVELPQIESEDEMRELHDSFVYLQTELVQYIKQLESTILSKEKIESELRIAHNIQMGMIPKIFPPFPDRNDVDLFAVLKPAKEVGGDLYDFFIKNDELYMAVGDVSGKGVPASLFMAVSRSLFRSIADKESSPKGIVEQMNSAIAETNERNMFVTFFAAVLNLQSGVLRFCNAGHNPPCIIDEDKQTVDFLQVDLNLPVGVFEDSVYTEQTITLENHQSLFLYTDGLNEAENAQNELYSNERLLATLSNLPVGLAAKDIIERMLQSVADYVEGAPQSDDLTMLTIKYAPLCK